MTYDNKITSGKKYRVTGENGETGSTIEIVRETKIGNLNMIKTRTPFNILLFKLVYVQMYILIIHDRLHLVNIAFDCLQLKRRTR